MLDGGGGDNVFCALQSVAPIAEALLRRAPRSEMLEAAGALAALAQTSVAKIFVRALQRAWLRSAAYRWPTDTHLLTREAIAAVGKIENQPWLVPPPGEGPGTAAHVALLLAAQGWAERLDPAPIARESPLATQPVAEACLSVPAWRWFGQGLSRTIARDAFADLLPQSVLCRVSKGSPDGFVAQLFERNRGVIRPLLLEGRLRSERIIDTAAIERALADPRPANGADYRRIMRLVDVEAWAHSLAI